MQNENWSDVPNFPGYQISDQGRLRSFLYSKDRGPAPPEGRILKGGHDRDGYRRAILCADNGKRRKSCKIAHLVAAAFVGPRPRRAVVRHLNGDNQDDRAVNLTYGSQKQNIQDKLTHGTMPLGEDHHSAKLTEEAVREIRLSPIKTAELARKFGVAYAVVWAVRRGKTWKHIS